MSGSLERVGENLRRVYRVQIAIKMSAIAPVEKSMLKTCPVRVRTSRGTWEKDGHGGGMCDGGYFEVV